MVAPSHVMWKDVVISSNNLIISLFIGYVAGTETVETGGDSSEGRGRAQGGNNSGAKWRGIKTSR